MTDFSVNLGASAMGGTSHQGCEDDCYVTNGKTGGSIAQKIPAGPVYFKLKSKLDLVVPGANKVATDPYGVPSTLVIPNPDGDKIIPKFDFGVGLGFEKAGFKTEGTPGGPFKASYNNKSGGEKPEDFRFILGGGHGGLRPYSKLRPGDPDNPSGDFGTPFGGLPPYMEPSVPLVLQGGFENFRFWRFAVGAMAGVGLGQSDEGVSGSRAWFARGSAGIDFTKVTVAVEAEAMEAQAAADPTTHEMFGKGSTVNWPLLRLMANIPDLHMTLYGARDLVTLSYTTSNGAVDQNTKTYYAALAHEMPYLFEGMEFFFMYGVRELNSTLSDVQRASDLDARSRLLTFQLAIPITPLNEILAGAMAVNEKNKDKIGVSAVLTVFDQRSGDTDPASPLYNNTGVFGGLRFGATKNFPGVSLLD